MKSHSVEGAGDIVTRVYSEAKNKSMRAPHAGALITIGEQTRGVVLDVEAHRLLVVHPWSARGMEIEVQSWQGWQGWRYCEAHRRQVEGCVSRWMGAREARRSRVKVDGDADWHQEMTQLRRVEREAQELLWSILRMDEAGEGGEALARVVDAGALDGMRRVQTSMSRQLDAYEEVAQVDARAGLYEMGHADALDGCVGDLRGLVDELGTLIDGATLARSETEEVE